MILALIEKYQKGDAMAKASTVTAFARKAKSVTATLPADKKAAAKSAKPADAATATLNKSGAPKASLKQAAPKRGPMKQVAARTSPSGKSVSGRTVAKKQTARPAAVAKTAAAARTEAVKTAGAKRAGGKSDVAKRAAAKQAASRRLPAKPAAPSPAARRSRPVASAKRARPPSRPASAKPPQSFTVSHLNEADFKPDGLRSYAHYRDLGMAAATAGLCQAHVIRFIPPCTEEVRKRHRHAADLQLVYVLRGWMKNEFAGIGEQMMSTGSCWLQPSGIEHTVLDYSADCEVLEIIVPADFKTEDVG